jgi:hypothetical protein
MTNDRTMETAEITDAMVERACRAYVRGVQETFSNPEIDYEDKAWRAFEDENWMNERIPMRKALEAALS